MAKKMTSHEYYVLLQIAMVEMHRKPFKIDNFQRIIQKFCKTSKLKDKVLFLNIKGSKNSIKIEIQNDNYFVVTNNEQKFEFHLYCENSLELLQKLIYHNLLIP
jgi:hypothetical protein